VRARAASTALALWVAGWLAGCAGESAEPAGISTVLVTLDTTRADALGCYGSPVPTPALDRLAREGVVYENAHTVAPLTLPAHASMLTGLYPPRHTLRENSLWPLPASARTLAEEARAAGYETAAFVAAVVLDERFGLQQGFDVYDAPVREAGRRSTHAVERPGDEVASAAAAWLAQRDPTRRFFLWMHLFDPHGPFAPPQRFRTGALAGNPYLGEVAAADAAVGILLDALEENGELGRALVLVVGDHGEGLGDHGEESHGALCYESTMRVPFLLRFPDGSRAGERSREVVSVVDVHPTLAEAMGLPSDATLDGESLLRRVPAERGVYFESYSGFLSYGWSPLSGWLDAEGKYLHSSQPQLFDLAADPGEASDLLEAGERDAARYRDAIAEVAGREPLEASGESLDAGALEDVRALGYAGIGADPESLPHPLAPSDLPSPQSRKDALARALSAMELVNAGRAREAEPLLVSVLEENPRNAFALDRLALARMHQGRFEEAIEPLQRMLADGPPWAFSHYNLGLCLVETGRRERALESLRTALALDPGIRSTVDALVESLRQRGRQEEADYYERGLSGSEEQ